MVNLVTNIEYNAAGQRTRITYGNGTVVNYTYNPTSLRLTKKKTTNAASVVLQELNYTYDSVGNILTIVDAVNTATQTFTYDALNRLVSATGTQYGTKNYTYDEIGNILTKEGVSYTYSKVNAGPHAVTSLSNGTSMTYDTNGNMTAKNVTGLTTGYEFDVENRLLKVRKNSTLTAEYGYDGDGGRVKRTVYGTTTSTTRYIGSLFEKTDGKNTEHLYLGGEKLASVVDGELVYYFTDHLGGTNVVSDYDGVQIELDEYLPYGEFSRRVRSSEKVTNYFTGQKLDDESGLYYYGARYYDPAIGRFITPDTIVQSPYDPQTLNRYSYCGNNPVNRIDPDGHSFWKKLGRALGDGFGSFAGGQIGGLLGSFFGPLGSFIGGQIGSSIGSSIQHGGNVGISLGTDLLNTALSAWAYNAGHQVGGAFGNEAMANLMGATAAAAVSTHGEIFSMSVEDIGVQITASAVYMGANIAINSAVDKMMNGSKAVIDEVNSVNTTGAEKGVYAQAIQAEANNPNRDFGLVGSLQRIGGGLALDALSDIKTSVPSSPRGSIISSNSSWNGGGRSGVFKGGAKSITRRAINALGVAAKVTGTTIGIIETVKYSQSAYSAFSGGDMLTFSHDFGMAGLSAMGVAGIKFAPYLGEAVDRGTIIYGKISTK